ncbi:MAG: hypothetical protein M3305_15055 [Actinomycetota bacterium]|nr:hypothetical protein [Actinomycetota bacterium]
MQKAVEQPPHPRVGEHREPLPLEQDRDTAVGLEYPSGTNAATTRFRGKSAARMRAERRLVEHPSANSTLRPSMLPSSVISTLQASGVLKASM